MTTHTFTHEGVTVTIRTRKGMDNIGAPYMQLILLRHIAPEVVNDAPLHIWIPIERYTRLVQQTVKVEGLDFVFPSAISNEAQLIEGYETLLGELKYLPLFELWLKELETLDRAPNEDPSNPTKASVKQETK